MNNSPALSTSFGGLMDFYHENEYLVELSNWFDSDIYGDILDYLNHYRPEWRKNKELGRNAPECILEVINEVGSYSAEDDILDDDGQYRLNLYGYQDWLIRLYDAIEDSYRFYRGGYQLSQEAEDDLSIIDVDYSGAFDMVYVDEGEVIPFWF